MPPPGLLARVDHLVYAACDLDQGVADIEHLLGVRATPGGRHPTWGTRNALVALGPRCYLEIIAPDPDRSPGAGVRPFGLNGLGPPRLAGWAANATGLEQLRAAAVRLGITLGNVLSGSRRQPDGAVLNWALTDLYCVLADGVVPFFIDWGESPHPASAAPTGAALVSLRAEHPAAGPVRDMLGHLALELPVTAGPLPALVAEIDCPNGRVLLR
jgi:hypothetical protein